MDGMLEGNRNESAPTATLFLPPHWEVRWNWNRHGLIECFVFADNCGKLWCDVTWR
jgi:hypothetical protein